MKMFRRLLSNIQRRRSTMSSNEAQKGEQKSRAVWIGRAVFLMSLSLAAAVLGIIIYRLQTSSEEDLAESQLNAITDRALHNAFQITNRKRLGTLTMATVAANANPDVMEWPFITIEGYEDIATRLIETSSGREMGFAPLVTPQQLSQFEDFAYDYYYNSRNPPFPNTTAISSFGRGVWGVDPGLNTSDNRYHESDGTTTYNSPNKIFAPILQHNAGTHMALMLNLHFQETRGVVIDNIIACSEKRKKAQNLGIECGEITDFLILTSQEFRPGPGALIMQPIYPARTPFELGGILASSIIWDEVLTDVFTASVSGVNCILTTPGGQYRYRITEGRVNAEAEGDTNDKDLEDYCQSIDLVEDTFFSENSVKYTLKICPSSTFLDTYSTKNPTVATIGSVCIIVFSALIFLFYDRCVRIEFDAKQGLLEAKRKFVRFVSHEIRTPLNSVCMGLALLQAEMAKAIKKDHDVSTKQTMPQPKITDDLEEWHSFIEDIRSNAQCSVDVLNDILNFDKIELGSLRLELELVPVWHLFEKVVKEFKISASKKNVNLRLIYDGGREDEEVGELDKFDLLPAEFTKMIAVADPFRLSQVLRNLLSNAIKFSPETSSVSVHASFKPSEFGKSVEQKTLQNGQAVQVENIGEASVEVTDMGAGMSQEQMTRLFRQGVQFDANKLQGGQGSGLGLFIAKGIAVQHGGTLTARSPGLGMGTTFSFSLPIYHLLDDCVGAYSFGEDEIEETTNSPLPAVSKTSRPLHVLVVDDSNTNRRFLARWLRNHGHVCQEAADGVEAVEAVAKCMAEGGLFDSILIDYEMPRLNGPKAVKVMRDAGCDSFIIGISGNVLSEDVAYFRDHGANAVLPKPVHFPELENLWSEYGLICHHPCATNAAQEERV